ncbi:MAG: histidine kinase [Clostridia bacterium]|nr:histidine kinase [Clostridia bacterium]
MKYQSEFFKKLFRPYFLVFTLFITVAMISVCYGTFEHIKNAAYNNELLAARQTAQQIDSYINELNLLAEQVKHQPKATNLFYTLGAEPEGENYFDSDILSSIDISSALKNLLAGRDAKTCVVIYNGNGDFISSSEYSLNKDYFKKMSTNEMYNKSLKEIQGNKGIKVSMAEKGTVFSDGNEYISIAKTLKNDYSEDVYAIVEVFCNSEALKSAVIDDFESGALLLVDRKSGEVLYPEGGTIKDNDIMHVTAFVSNTNWEISAIHSNPFTRSFKLQVIGGLSVIYISLLIMAFSVTRFIGRRVTKPITRLTEYVRGIYAPDSVKEHFVDDKAIDEILELEESFDKMLERVNKSLLQEKNAYYMALQAQMNPHFLYNSLAVIGSLGAEDGSDRVASMCSELSDMLRYVTSYETVSVALREEVEHTKHYLSLMKARYEDYFSYNIDASQELMVMPVPKLFIQPLAENCFKHGFKTVAPPWRIEIKMTGTPRCWTLTIKDNGSGISDEKIKEIEAHIDSMLLKNYIDSEHGIGVANTIVRLKMTHNENIRYEIKNDKGTVISIISKFQ